MWWGYRWRSFRLCWSPSDSINWGDLPFSDPLWESAERMGISGRLWMNCHWITFVSNGDIRCGARGKSDMVVFADEYDPECMLGLHFRKAVVPRAYSETRLRVSRSGVIY